MRQCYQELKRPATAPLATIEAAFKPHSLITITERVKDARGNLVWKTWPFDFPTNDGVPGTGHALPSLWDYIEMIVDWMKQVFNGLLHDHSDWADTPFMADLDVPHWWDTIHREIPADGNMTPASVPHQFLDRAQQVAQQHPHASPEFQQHSPSAISWFLEQFIQWFWRRVEPDLSKDDDLRRLWILLDLGQSNIRGMIADDVLIYGLDSLDNQEYRTWLRRHGASDLAVNSHLIQGLYDLAFAYEQGEGTNPSKANFAAGASIRAILRMVFAYQGAIFWKMQAGMGDTVFTPLYQVLKARGVQFKFFHRVANLGLSEDERAIASIALYRQVKLNSADYDPLVSVSGLDCWPSQPRYEQIAADQRQLLIDNQINLESFWTPWKTMGQEEQITLSRANGDFDKVILGISLGALPGICPELLNASKTPTAKAASRKWRSMVQRVQTVQTQAFQLWLKPDLKDLGWQTGISITSDLKGSYSTVMDAYVQPMNTWADMSQLSDRETWPADKAPKNIAYFCGPLQDPQGGIPPASDHAFPAQELTVVTHTVNTFLQQDIGFLWPKSTTPQNPNGLNLNLLVDPKDGIYLRANVDPSERYVLSVAGSTQYRLKAGESGFENLYLAGDWLRCGLNAGCIEAATMGGMQASRVICGYPKTIVGEVD
ncbi:MAG: amine oxidase [Leptolyngbyaceae cyanobacterium RU_5_1]|nr:amine oxidase [Leptolyngbyaceae cyanobacterium RU_5_1]